MANGERKPVCFVKGLEWYGSGRGLMRGIDGIDVDGVRARVGLLSSCG
jgi:hypothetical protein